jgi:RNA polymerase primary sigma factor
MSAPRRKPAPPPPSAAAPDDAAPPPKPVRAPAPAARSRADEPDRSERTSMRLYMQEIGQIPLLTPQQEVELAARIRKGDRAARDLMIKSNLRLVVKIAFDYKDFGLQLNDLISEGNLGLIKAVERFDPAKGGKLSTYAAWWIKQSIKRALANQSKTIRLPVHLVDKISRMRRTAAQLADELEREPTDDELAEVMGIPVRKIAHLKTVSARPASLDAPVGDTADSASFGEIVGDENSPSPFERLRDKGVRDDLHDLLGQLEPREAEILRLRFGLDGDDELTLEDVGRRFKITRERVRQLQVLAINKLRRSITAREALRTREQVDEETRMRDRMQVIRDFLRERRAGR